PHALSLPRRHCLASPSFSQCYRHHCALHSFPTRRSSDLSILQNKATLSSEGYATADVSSKAQAGSYQFFIKQLAGKDQYVVQDLDRKSTRLNSSHVKISYAVFCLKKKN